MIIGLIGFAAVVGTGLYIRFRQFIADEIERDHYRIARAERVTTMVPLPRRKPTVWDYERGIPSWNPALMMVSGFDPRTYRPHPGDADLV